MLKFIFYTLLMVASLTSYGADFVAGKDYVILNDKSPLSTSVDISSVTEFFSYGCPWCYRLEPSLMTWVNKKGSKIYYKKIPVVFNKDWEYYARAYYTANALSLDAQLNLVLFKAILDDKKPLNNNESMINFFTKNGVDVATAQSAFGHSPSIDIAVSSGQTLMTRYRINAVPSFVVNNQYKTDLQMAKTEERLFAILDYLLKKSETKKP